MIDTGMGSVDDRAEGLLSRRQGEDAGDLVGDLLRIGSGTWFEQVVVRLVGAFDQRVEFGVLRCYFGVAGAARAPEVVGALRDRTGHHDRCLDAEPGDLVRGHDRQRIERSLVARRRRPGHHRRSALGCLLSPTARAQGALRRDARTPADRSSALRCRDAATLTPRSSAIMLVDVARARRGLATTTTPDVVTRLDA